MSNDNVNQLTMIIKEVVKAVVKEETEPIREILNEHSRILNEHSRILNEHSRILNEHTDKIDALMVEMHDADKTIKAIWEKIDIETESQQRQIDKIKQHINLQNSL